jgi:hypothetical protein
MTKEAIVTNPGDQLAASSLLDAHHQAETEHMRASCTRCGFMTAVVSADKPIHLVTADEIARVAEWLAANP